MTPLLTIAKIIRTSLSNGDTLFVVFRKTDGTETNRKITRNLTLIPNDKHPKFVRSENPQYITAFDLDKGDWIRFHENDALACADYSREVEKMFS